MTGSNTALAELYESLKPSSLIKVIGVYRGAQGASGKKLCTYQFHGTVCTGRSSDTSAGILGRLSHFIISLEDEDAFAVFPGVIKTKQTRFDFDYILSLYL